MIVVAVVAPAAVAVVVAGAGAGTGGDGGFWTRSPVHALRRVSKRTPTLAAPVSLCLPVSVRYYVVFRLRTSTCSTYGSSESWRFCSRPIFQANFYLRLSVRFPRF